MKTWINKTAVAYLVDTVDQSGFIGLQVHAVGKQELAGRRYISKLSAFSTTFNGFKPMSFSKGVYVVGEYPEYTDRL